MLQIVTKMYFRPAVDLWETVHRDVLFTNALLPVRSERAFHVGRLLPSTGVSSWTSAMTVEVTEFLEKTLPDGTESGHIATGGLELIDDLADVLSFGLGVTFSRSRDLVRELVPRPESRPRPGSAAGLLRHIFEPGSLVSSEMLDGFDGFFRDLLALERPHFEAAMRAIHRVRRACERAGENATAAFTDLVAALESLSHETASPPPTWDRLDSAKRKILDKALDGLDGDQAGRIRQAILTAEHAGATHSFVHFVLDHLDESFYREGATEATHPVRGQDIERLLRWAYRARSENVHRLAEIKEKYWIFPDWPETVEALDGTLILTLEGMRRIADQVIRNYVVRSPKGVIAGFDWRSELPGTAQVRMAPQYWLHRADGLSKARAGVYFSGLVSLAVEAIAGRESLVLMDDTLAKIESIAPGLADGHEKACLIGFYQLFDRLAGEHARPNAKGFLDQQGVALATDSTVRLTVDLLTGRLADWAPEQLVEAADTRFAERATRRHLALPVEVDSAIQAIAADALLEVGETTKTLPLAARAVEEAPGNGLLLAWERRIANGEAAILNLRELVLRLDPNGDGTDDGVDEGANSAS